MKKENPELGSHISHSNAATNNYPDFPSFFSATKPWEEKMWKVVVSTLSSAMVGRWMGNLVVESVGDDDDADEEEDHGAEAARDNNKPMWFPPAFFSTFAL